MTKRLQRLNTVYLLCFGVVALGLLYWGVLRGPGLLEREDNPRLVEAELRVQRGQILDRQGVVLVETVGDLGQLERRYRLPAAPAVGYYSLRYGVAGIEGSYDSVLRGQTGDFWSVKLDQLLHRYPAGRDIQLTLDADLQALAEAALAGRAGAVVLLEARSGDILVLASQPGYNPNTLDDQFEDLEADERAPLLNRATQGLYQPGAALQPFLLAAGLEAGVISADATARDLDIPVLAGGVWLDCVMRPPGRDALLATALAWSCPSPFAQLASQLGEQGVQEALADFGLFELPELPLQLGLGERPSFAGDTLPAEAMGQGQLTLSPLQVAWALAAVANDGVRPSLRLVQRIGHPDTGLEIVEPAAQSLEPSLPSHTAADLTAIMVEAAEHWFGPNEPDEGRQIAGHVGLAAAGPEQSYHSWFLGFTPAYASDPLARYVVVVLLEETADVRAAAEIGHALLSH